LNQKYFMIHRQNKCRGGFALVLILSFIVLLVVVTLAFFSYSILQRQISNSSANMEKVNLFAQGALDTTVGDLQQEIVDGSTPTTVTTGSVTTTLYAPTLLSGTTGLYPSMVPYLVNGPASGNASTTATSLPNLVKESISGQTFYPNASPYAAAGPSRAASSLTTTASLNGRSISLMRWNEPLLLPRKNPGSTSTDLTPASAFTTPSWIYVDTTGKNPTSFPSSSSPQIVGRYAYCIYNEGGLLDMNVAGYPVATLQSQADVAAASHKSGTSFADLTSFLDPTTGTPGNPYLTQAQVDQILGWRNYATTQPSGSFPSFTYNAGSVTNYFQNVVAPSTGFMTAANTALSGSSSNQSDQKFTSRQQLIDFLTGTVGASRDLVQYLGTFSRTLDQPSVWPDSSRPAVVGAAPSLTVNTSGTTTPAGVAGVATGYFPNSSATGGNNASGLDNSINPAFLQVAVPSAWASTTNLRNDGTPFVQGEPLVKKRFGLNRLAWITYLGPIADNNGNLNNNPSSSLYVAANASYFTKLINTLENTYGISAAFLSQGGPTNIKTYFGLTSHLESGSTTNCYWTYNHGITTSATKAIGLLSDVQALPSANAREADFFELLKAAITVGCLGKGAATNHTIGASAPYPSWVDVNQYDIDTNTDFQVLQIGANIMDQFSSAAYPIHIQYSGLAASGLTSTTWNFYGDDNLPYLYRARTVAIVNGSATYTETGASGSVTANRDNALLLPEIWNPHDPNSNNNNTSSSYVGPTNFRFFLAQGSTAALGSTTPATTNIYSVGQCRVFCTPSTTTIIEPPAQDLVPTNQGSPVALDPNPPPTTTSTSGSTSVASTELDFSIPQNAANTYYEPLFLGGLQQSGVQGSHCIGSAGPANINGSWTGGFGTNQDKLATSNYYSGVFLGFFRNIWPYNQGTPYPGGATGPWSNILPAVTQTSPATLFPLQPSVTPSNNYGTYNPATCDQFTVFPSVGGSLSQIAPFVVDYILQYQDPLGNWITYQDNTSTIPTPGEASTSLAAYNSSNTGYSGPQVIDISSAYSWPQNSTPGSQNNAGAFISWMDPRTSRFGAFLSSREMLPSSNGLESMSSLYYGESDTPALGATATTGLQYGQGFDEALPGTGLGPSSGTSGNKYSSLTSPYLGSVIGWYPGNWSGPSINAQFLFVPGYYAENIVGTRHVGNPSTSTSNYFADPDGVVRRGMGAYVGAGTPANTIGLPLDLLSSSPPSPAVQTQSRPFMLKRPFRSVAELGYAFSGTPWRNLDFYTPESGYASLLDVFCVNETSDTSARVAGKVDLNTRQAPVLQAILSGTGGLGYAYKDEVSAGQATTTASLSSTEVAGIAQALVNRTTATTTSGEGPLRNVSELVGKWNKAVTVTGAVSPFNIDGSKSFLGFSSDLVNDPNGTTSPSIDLTSALTSTTNDPSTLNIQRLRESAMRALSSAGQTRVWNLMIDLVAQTGRYKPGETNLDNFAVDGEQRYWLHVAIDRFTGKVIDEQLEEVKE
jgi:hypothetical protein